MKVKVKLKKIGDISLTRIEKIYEKNSEDMKEVIQQIESENEGCYIVWIREVE